MLQRTLTLSLVGQHHFERLRKRLMGESMKSMIFSSRFTSL